MNSPLIHDRKTISRLIRELFAVTEPPQPCLVCGKYRHVCHAHHVIPVHQMARLCARKGVALRDFARLPVRFIWLCPTHHALFHLLDRPHSDARGQEIIEDLGIEEYRALKVIWAAQNWQEFDDFLDIGGEL